MKQRLIVRQERPDSWCVSGEGMNFYVSCSDRESALFVAHQTRNQWYPRARVVELYQNGFGAIEFPNHPIIMDDPREERFKIRELRDSMKSDWNE